MFARTVWSDDVLADTIHDIIHHFKLSSLKVLGTEGSENHKTLTDKLKENHKSFTEKLKKNHKMFTEKLRVKENPKILTDKLQEKSKTLIEKLDGNLSSPFYETLQHDPFSLCDTFIEYAFHVLF